MPRINALAAVVVAALVAAAPASASWHPAGGTIKYDVVRDYDTMTVYFHYSARAQVWGAAPTGAGMAIRNAYMERLQEGAQLFDYGAAVGMRFLYVGKWYRARVKALGWWLYVDNVRYGAEHTRWHMRLKVQYLGHTTYEMPPPARMASNSPGWIQAGGDVDFDAGTPGYWKRRYVSKALHNRAMPGAAAIRLRDAFIANT